MSNQQLTRGASASVLAACFVAASLVVGCSKPKDSQRKGGEVSALSKTKPKRPELRESVKPSRASSLPAKGPYKWPTPPKAPRKYRFTTDWFTRSIPSWERALYPYAGKKNLRYLEVGVFEGRSVIWMLDHVLTDASSRVTALDLFPDGLDKRFLYNIEQSGAAKKVELVKGFSSHTLRGLKAKSYDIAYIDGSHTAADTLSDAVLVWPLLEEGGLLIFDDYRWKPSNPAPPPELLPKLAVDTFITTHNTTVEVVYRAYQLIVRKKKSPCLRVADCSPIGPYQYYWFDRQLRDSKRKTVALSKAERALVQELALQRPLGYARIHPSAKLRAKSGFAALVKRLGLSFPEEP